MTDDEPDHCNTLLHHLLQHRSEIFAYIRSMVRNTHDAEDLFQDVALVVVKTGAAQNSSIENFRAWAKTVALHRVQRFFSERQKARARSLPVEEMVGVAEAAFQEYNPPLSEIEGQQEALRECMEEVPVPTRDAIRMRYADGREYRDIAGLIGRTEAATRRLVSRTRLALIECVQTRLTQRVWKTSRGRSS